MAKSSKACSVLTCNCPTYAKAFCRSHHYRFVKYGNPLSGPTKRGEPLDWLFSHVSFDGKDCLIWPFARMKNGYPSVRSEGKSANANRIMCEKANGTPPTKDHEAAHSCGKGHNGCIHPKHLSWKTPIENSADRIVHGTDSRGEKSPTAKISAFDVSRIINMSKTMNYQEISKHFPISRSQVRRIILGERWNYNPPQSE